MTVQIPDKLFFRIGEVARLLEVKPSVLRFWETEFAGVAPRKSRAGQRVYRRTEVERLARIRELLYVQRYSIEGARRRLRSGGGVVAGADALRLLHDIEALAETPISRLFAL